MRFYYNPQASDLDPSDASHAGDALVHAKLIQSVADSNVPKYPEKARADKIDGIVRLEGDVETDGVVKNVKVIEGDAMLGEASSEAIRKWRFEPATLNGAPVEEQVRSKVAFRLDGTQVRTQVVWPDPVAIGKPVQ